MPDERRRGLNRRDALGAAPMHCRRSGQAGGTPAERRTSHVVALPQRIMVDMLSLRACQLESPLDTKRQSGTRPCRRSMQQEQDLQVTSGVVRSRK